MMPLKASRFLVNSSNSLRPFSVRIVFSNSADASLIRCFICLIFSWLAVLDAVSLWSCRSRMATRICWKEDEISPSWMDGRVICS